MKNRIFLIIISLVFFLIAGCDKYTDVELSSECFDQFPTTGYFSGQHGKIQSATENDQANLIVITNSDGNSEIIFACNLPTEYQKRGLEVIFDAEIKDVPEANIFGTPVHLTALKVKK